MGIEQHDFKNPERRLSRAIEKHKRQLAAVPKRYQANLAKAFRLGIRVGVFKCYLVGK